MLSIILDSLNGWVWPSNILELCDNIVTIILISIIYKKKKSTFSYIVLNLKYAVPKGSNEKLQNGNFNTLNVTLSMKHTQSSCSCMNQPRTVNN